MPSDNNVTGSQLLNVSEAPPCQAIIPLFVAPQPKCATIVGQFKTLQGMVASLLM